MVEKHGQALTGTALPSTVIHETENFSQAGYALRFSAISVFKPPERG
jgi:hypothetical protein